MRYNAYYLTLHDINVTQKTVKHSSYISTTTGSSNALLGYYYVSAFAKNKPDPTHLFDIISLGVDAVLCHDHDTRETVHIRALSRSDLLLFHLSLFY